MNRCGSLSSVLLFGLLVAGCAGEPPAAPAAIGPDSLCALDGMSIGDYPGPKAQIHYDDGPPEFYCDTVEMFAMVLQPESRRRIRAIFTQDMARTDWNEPRDHWIDARAAFYVEGSNQGGSMGPTLASFARREDADAFAREHGGSVLAFAEVTPKMADLRGGARLDDRM